MPSFRTLTSGDSHFFGFHDLVPWDPSSAELLCLRTPVPEDHVPTHDEPATVGRVDEATGAFTPIGPTHAWNWQQGARQQWIPARGERTILYNTASDDGFRARVLDLDTGEARLLDAPVYIVSPDGQHALTPSFHRLQACTPAYGYDHPRPPTTLPPYDEDGIFAVDLDTGAASLLVSIADVLALEDLDPDAGRHYVTHVTVAPSSERFCFLHRCIRPTGSILTNLVIAEMDGTGVRVVARDKVSHFDWHDDDHIVAWTRKNAAIQKLKESPLLKFAKFVYRLSRSIRSTSMRQSVYGEAFRQINVHTGATERLGQGVLDQDGHMQIHPTHNDLWVNDTYADENQMQTLMLYHQATNERRDLAVLPIPPEIQDTEWRCDFHPRWDPTGTKVCFDSAHDGRRQLCVQDVADLVDELTPSTADSVPA